MVKAIETPYAEANRLCPLPEYIATLKVDDLAALGIVQTRARAIITLAQEVSAGRLRLEAGTQPEVVMRQLTTLPGIGEWTALYRHACVALAGCIPKEDIALRNRLGGVTAKN